MTRIQMLAGASTTSSGQKKHLRLHGTRGLLSLGCVVLMFGWAAMRHDADFFSLSPAGNGGGKFGRTTSEEFQRYKCEMNLPRWTRERTAAVFKEEVIVGSDGLTDKTNSHGYQHMYHRYLAPLAKRTCDKDQNNLIRIFEIGLGCHKTGGMIRNTPGGSALAWRHLFPSPAFELDLHVMEFDRECAMQWAETHKDVANVHVGDASNGDDLKRIMEESGGKPFDLIIDDGSHINSHQISSLSVLIEHVAPAGIYVIEDIMAACKNFKVNSGKVETRARVGGTPGCMETIDGKPTILSVLLEGQKKLAVNLEPYPSVNHIDICSEAAVLQKIII
mmetsp:Transcript_16760/g.31750  ORF Transcript_16760/g.31750 Transcript_16760/m.31750 type:complete len:333 (+) Transcript_16760:182-1180(+)|eukprot:CAMPEP_0176491754 /NCGR_PEP_ID=MMETSP0200_2-20121128/8604_1 /TAXON_ID=947934 /ORGANISM="Chaetoceros sp., Strain GSL56" /LENGTH=332 /DNA_ID=CAMNT_0017889211 /DNA_START=92 /DNA_END=1090 /DNA_ORIENTATION=+